MKPVRLTLCGWGPYKDKQEIDFARLHEGGIFLITGPTGAGKTTVFDAIAYALYGCMSGEMREKSSVRSDFAAAGDPTYVELVMTHGKETYSICRNPEYLRASRRKSKKGEQEGKTVLVKEREKAVLTCSDGKIVEGAAEVTKAVSQLLHLDQRQFKQLSMIAQGEFARFLSAPSNEKTKIFRELFDTALYERMAAALKGRSAEVYGSIRDCSSKIEEDIDLFVPAPESAARWQELAGQNRYYPGVTEFLSEESQREKKLWEKTQAEWEEKEKQVQELNRRQAEGEKIRSLFEKLKEEERKEKFFAAQGPVFAEKEELLKRQEAALKVHFQEIEIEKEQNRLQRLKTQYESGREQVESLKTRRQREKSFYEMGDKIEEAYGKLQELEETRRRQEQEEAAVKESDGKLKDAQKRLLAAEKQEECLKRSYEEADKAYRHSMAGILAGDLAEGIPCPVCGSPHHPSPAVSGKAIAEDQVLERQQLYEEQKQKRIRYQEQAQLLVQQKEEAEKRWKQCKKEYEGLLKRMEALAPKALDYAGSHTKEQYQQSRSDYEKLLAVLEEKQQEQQRREKEYQEGQKQLEKISEDFHSILIQKGFSDREDYRKNLTEEKEIESLREQIQEYKRQRHANGEMLVHLREETGRAQKTNLEKIAEELELARQERAELLERKTALHQRWQEAEKTFLSLKEKQKELARLKERYSLLKGLDDTANGNNKKRLMFEQYVLASYFDEILLAANLRLGTMSSGRYELRRFAGVQDGRSKDNLEIEVLDYYTGRYRSVKTLSGGEIFKASLALALGMSDVVQARSGGIRVEALFIDEGFGSLDAESIEQACLTLQSLVEKDRLIGIISHVPELAEKISSQIKVTKTNVGSRIEVMVS